MFFKEKRLHPDKKENSKDTYTKTVKTEKQEPIPQKKITFSDAIAKREEQIREGDQTENKKKYHEKALQAVKKFQNRLENREYLSQNDLSDYRRAIERYATSGNLLRQTYENQGYIIEEENERQWQETLRSLTEDYNQVVSFYSNFQNAEDYDEQLRNMERTEIMLTEDTQLLQKELEELQDLEQDYALNEQQLREYLLNPEIQNISEHQAKAISQWMENVQYKYGITELEELNALIADKEDYLSETKLLQSVNRYKAVRDPLSPSYDPDFQRYSAYESTKKVAGPGEGYFDVEYETFVGVNGPEYYTWYEDPLYEYINGNTEVDVKKEWEIYALLSEEEKQLFNYYRTQDKKYGTQNSEELLEVLRGVLEQRKKTEEASYFQAGAFSDGYQFLDLTKTIVGTGADIGENVLTAVVDATENLIDTTAHGIGTVAGRFDPELEKNIRDFIAKETLKPKETGEWLYKYLSGDILRHFLVGEDVEDASVFGDKMDGLVQSAAHMAGQYALSTVGVPYELTSAVNSFGSEIESAYQQGATFLEGTASGVLTTAGEMLAEKLFGVFGKGGAVNTEISKVVTEKISNSFLRWLANTGVSVVSNTAEELLSEIISRLGRFITYENDKTPQEMFFSDESWGDYKDTIISSVLMALGGEVVNVATAKEQGMNEADGQRYLDAELDMLVVDMVTDILNDNTIAELSMLSQNENVIHENITEAMSNRQLLELAGQTMEITDLGKKAYDALQSYLSQLEHYDQAKAFLSEAEREGTADISPLRDSIAKKEKALLEAEQSPILQQTMQKAAEMAQQSRQNELSQSQDATTASGLTENIEVNNPEEVENSRKNEVDITQIYDRIEGRRVGNDAETRQHGEPVRKKTRNERLEGKKHPITGVPFVLKQGNVGGKQVEVVVPEFENFYKTRLPEEMYCAPDRKQFKECNRQLKIELSTNVELRALFSEEQLAQIENEEIPDGYTWHHEVEAGVMILVNRNVHEKTGHTGGRYFWGGGTDNR